MSALTIAGIALEIQDGGEGEPISIGEQSRSFAGGLRGVIRDEKQIFNFTTMPTTSAVWVSLKLAIASGAHVAVSGTAIPHVAATCVVVANAKGIAGLGGYFIITGRGEEV